MMKSVHFLMIVVLLATGSIAQVVERKTLRPHGRVSPAYRYSAYTREAKVHIFRHSTKMAVIITPSLPIKYNEINYYWYGNYQYDASHPLKCEYHIDDSDHEFRNVSFRDGTKPPSIQFGCLTFEDCCGLQCCGDSRSSTLTMCGVFLFFLAVYVAISKYTSYAQKHRDSVTEITSPVTQPFARPNVRAV